MHCGDLHTFGKSYFLVLHSPYTIANGFFLQVSFSVVAGTYTEI